MKPETLERRASDRVRRRERVSSFVAEIDDVGVDEFCRLRYEEWPDVPTRFLRALNHAPVVPEYLVERFGRVRHRSAGREWHQAFLTPNRLDVFVLYAQGFTQEESAVVLGSTTCAVKDRLRCAIGVLAARNGNHAISIAHSQGLLDGVPPGKPRLVNNSHRATKWTLPRIEAFGLLAQGYREKEIAAKMSCHRFSVKDYLRCSFALVGGRNAPNAVHRGHLLDVLPKGAAA